MNIGYDECLDQNPFFQIIQENHSDIIEKATEEDWIICIPRIGTIEPTSISTEDILEHILVRNLDLPDTHFCTLTKQELIIRDKCIVIQNDERVRILFDETFYIDKSQRYKIWCVERPLHQKCTILANEDYSRVRSVHDCVKLLWTKNQGVLDEINKVIEKFLTNSFEFDNIEMLKEKSSVLYENCIGWISKESCFSDNITLAVETYMHHCIHHRLFRAICNCMSQADANFNKILRNLSDVQLRDLEISNEFLESISSIKFELSGLNKVSTILGKIECLQRILNTLSQQSQSFVTTDVLLKIFVHLIIKSNINNWLGNLTYITHFRLSILNLTDENSFLITTLEAAIEYIKSGDIRPKSGLDKNGKNSSSIDSLNSFLACIEVGNLSAIRKVFDNKNKNIFITDKIPLCHPLCSCEKCKSRLPFSINSRNDKGCTALHIACLHGQPHVVEYLLGKNVEINVLDHSESMPLHYAALKGNQNALLLLLHANVETEPKDCDGNTPLHLAANNGHDNCVKALLYFAEQKGSFVNVNSRNNVGNTPLHFAAKWGYIGIVDILLQYGAEVGIMNKRNQNVLDIAHNDYLRKLLLAAKNDKNQKQSNFIALDSNVVQITNKNMEPFKKTDLVLKAIENNDLPLMCFYLGIPNPQNSTNLDMRLTCHPLCTCENCQKQFENSNSSPPSFQNVETVNINTCNGDGYSPLHMAAKCGRTEIVRLLLDVGALVNIKTTKHHWTPLHVACKNQRIQIVREFLQCGGCDLDVQDSKGNTPLHCACLNKDTKIVELLLSNGSDCNIKNNEGKTPLQEAKSRMLCNIVKLLKGKCESSDSPDHLSDLLSL